MKKAHFKQKLLSSDLYILFFCLVNGALFALTLPPISFVIISPLVITFFLHCIMHSKTKKMSFFTGYFFGLGHFTTMLYWIPESLRFVPDLLWLYPIAILAIPVILSIYTGICSLATSFFSYSRVSTWLAFSSIWCLCEFLRSSFILPFPWGLSGYIFNFSIEILQYSSIAGIYGLSFLVMLTCSCLYTKSKRTIFCMLVILLSIFLYGKNRINNNLFINDKIQPTLRIIQPITPPFHNTNDSKISSLNKLLRLSLDNLPQSVEHIIWPEGSFPFLFNKNCAWPNYLATLSNNKTNFIISSDQFDNNNFYNSIILINKEGHVEQIYDKQILVPFGEYIPLKSYLPNFIKKITNGAEDFVAGNNNKTFFTDNFNFITTICYEAIFPFYINKNNRQNADFILNTSNDIWFGETKGPHQHAIIAKIRGIETGLPVIRSANNGISFVSDAVGRVIQKLDLNEEGFIDITLPPKIEYDTVYLSYRYGNFYIILGILIGLFSLEIIYRLGYREDKI